MLYHIYMYFFWNCVTFTCNNIPKTPTSVGNNIPKTPRQRSDCYSSSLDVWSVTGAQLSHVWTSQLQSFRSILSFNLHMFLSVYGWFIIAHFWPPYNLLITDYDLVYWSVDNAGVNKVLDIITVCQFCHAFDYFCLCYFSYCWS